MESMPRKLQALGKGAPSVESSLDDFISRANQEVATIPEASATPSPVAREQALQSEVDDLKKRLAAVATRKRPSQGWGKLVIGYVLGCASIFAVSALMPTGSAPVTQPTTAVTPPAPVASPPPALPPEQAPIVTPFEAPTPTPAPVAAAPEPPPPTPPPTTTKAKVTKKARPPAQQPQPTPAQAGSGDLYNPF
jgi:hypothetical protein